MPANVGLRRREGSCGGKHGKSEVKDGGTCLAICWIFTEVFSDYRKNTPNTSDVGKAVGPKHWESFAYLIEKFCWVRPLGGSS